MVVSLSHHASPHQRVWFPSMRRAAPSVIILAAVAVVPCSATTDAAITSATLNWLDGFIIKRQLCPFAAAARSSTKTIVCHGGQKDAALAVQQEAALLRAVDVNKPATTLVILPDFSSSFEDLMLLQEIESAKLDADESAAMIQLLAFHPLAEFSDIPNDPADLSMRSPYPILHLLRDSDVQAAEDIWEQQHAPGAAPGIQERNAALLRGIGFEAAAAEARSSWDGATETASEDGGTIAGT